MLMILHQKWTRSTSVLCTLLTLVFKIFFYFLVKANINIDLAFQGYNNREKFVVGVYFLGGLGFPKNFLGGLQSVSILISALISMLFPI
jgi:hypothetical protein